MKSIFGKKLDKKLKYKKQSHNLLDFDIGWASILSMVLANDRWCPCLAIFLLPLDSKFWLSMG